MNKINDIIIIVLAAILLAVIWIFVGIVNILGWISHIIMWPWTRGEY